MIIRKYKIIQEKLEIKENSVTQKDPLSIFQFISMTMHRFFNVHIWK